MDFFSQFDFSWHWPSWTEVAIGFGLFLIFAAASIAVTAFIIIRIPVDYFRGPRRPAWQSEKHPIWRPILIVGRNLVGYLLVVAGVIMSLPGVPGQGILTILIGLMIVDFPGKRKLEKRLVNIPLVRRGLNRTRQKFGRPPLTFDET